MVLIVLLYNFLKMVPQAVNTHTCVCVCLYINDNSNLRRKVCLLGRYMEESRKPP